MDYLAQQLINGTALGSIYGLIAIGYTMVYGIVGMINFAHGEVFMVGAFAALIGFLSLLALGVTAVPLALALALIVAIAAAGLLGWALERIAYRPLRGSFRLAPLITAIGASIFLMNFMQLAQDARVKSLPPVITGTHVLHESAGGFAVSISNAQLLVIGATLAIMALFAWVIASTPLGRAQRAVEQDMRMAALVGVDVDRTIATTFMLGAGLAAVAGFMYLIYYGTIDFGIGFIAGIKAFTAAVLGGIGSLHGAMLGGLIIGLTETLWAGYVSAAYKDVAAFGLLAVTLIFLPQGLLGRPEVEKV